MDRDIFATAKKNQFSIAPFFSHISTRVLKAGAKALVQIAISTAVTSSYGAHDCFANMCGRFKRGRFLHGIWFENTKIKKMKYACLHSKTAQQQKLVLLKMLQVFHVWNNTQGLDPSPASVKLESVKHQLKNMLVVFRQGNPDGSCWRRVLQRQVDPVWEWSREDGNRRHQEPAAVAQTRR